MWRNLTPLSCQKLNSKLKFSEIQSIYNLNARCFKPHRFRRRKGSFRKDYLKRFEKFSLSQKLPKIIEKMWPKNFFLVLTVMNFILEKNLPPKSLTLPRTSTRIVLVALRGILQYNICLLSSPLPTSGVNWQFWFYFQARGVDCRGQGAFTPLIVLPHLY